MSAQYAVLFGVCFWGWSMPAYAQSAVRGDGLIFPFTVAALVVMTGVSVWALFFRGRAIASERASFAVDDLRFRELIDSLPVLISYVDKDEIYRFNNAAYDDWFGYAPNKIVGKSVPVVIGDEAYRTLEGHIKKALLGEKVHFESEIPYRAGGTRFVTADYIPHRGATGEVSGFFALVEDITRHKMSERHLAAKINELNSQKFALDEHAIVSIADVNGNITYANDKFCTISGFQREELIGRNHRILKSGDHTPDFYRDLWATISSGKVWNGIIKNVTKKGAPYWVEATIVPFLDEQGKPFQYVAIRTDITARINAENMAQAALHEAEKANQAKSEFLSSMSHELRTPLNAILGFGQLMDSDLSDPLSADHKASLGHILRSGNHLLDLINEVLDLSKIESGNLLLNIEDFEPAEIIDACIAMAENMGAPRGVRVADKCAGDKLPLIHADATRFKQVLLNLLSNAVKYNKDNGTVTLECEQIGDHLLRFLVTDTGKGIAAEDLGDLFLPFHRLSHDSGIIEGTGIGLTITKKMVEVMSGNIGFETEEGVGSVFWFELPLAEASCPPAADGQDSVAEGMLPTESGKVRTVLYIEDDAANLNLMEILISRLPNVRLISSHTAALGLARATTDQPDVILMDINMPGLNGLQVLQQLRENPKTAAIPVIAMTADAMPSQIEQGRAAGFYEYVTKPIQIERTVSTILSALSTD